MRIDTNGLFLFRRRRKDDTEMDITPMIDIVFLLLVFFIVCSTMGRNTVVQLPKAQYGVGINQKTSTVVTITGIEEDSTVYLGDAAKGSEMSDDKAVQREELMEAVQRGLRQGKTNVVIRADRKLHHGEVVRVESIVTSVPGISLYVIVDDR